MDFKIDFACSADCEWLVRNDHHISSIELQNKIMRSEVLILRAGSASVGWLRWNLFWDNTPFMNLVALEESVRGKGQGRALVTHWEQHMHRSGYTRVLTSTLANEQAQHFYRKLGYIDCGALLLPGEPLEILFLKNL